jgi:DNA-binding MarR family transcriptional regulator
MAHSDQAVPASELVADVGAETLVDPVSVEAVRVLARLARMLERATDELSLANYRILAAIGSGDERASRVGQRLALGKPTVSATVEALCSRGLVSRSSVDGDQRAVALAVTPAGRVLLERVERAMVGQIVDVCDRVPDGRRLVEALSRLGPAITASLDERPRHKADAGPVASTAGRATPGKRAAARRGLGE